MKCLTLALVAIFLCVKIIAQITPDASPAKNNHSSSQKDKFTFGQVDKDDLLLKDCDFESKAEAMVLFDMGEFYCDIRPLTTSNERHIRIKIFNAKGFDRANVHIPYYSNNNDQTVNGITAQTYNLDADGNVVITKLDKKTIFNKRIDKRYSEVAFTLPEVKAGCVIEYKYSIYGSQNSSWYFQKSIPVLFSQYKVNFPRELEMQCMPYCILPYKSFRDNKGNKDIQTFTMENIPSLKDEAYISCDEDYLQRVDAKMVAVDFPGFPRQNLTKTWPNIIRDLMEDVDFGLQLKRNIPRTEDLDLLLKDIKSPYQKMTTIHEYVRNNMKWTEYDNIWALEGVKSAWKDKKGTSGEINLILVNLLKDAGLKAHPVLISTRKHGRINAFNPTTRQFNKVMAYVEIDSNVYVLDATEMLTPARLIPQDAIASEGLVIEKPETFEWGWKTLWDNSQVYENTILILAEVDSSGVMKGDATVTSYDHARVERSRKLNEGKEPFMKTFYTSANPDLKIDSVNFDNEKKDSLPLIQRVSFTESLNSSGDYKYFTANMFSGLEKNQFLADNRFSDIFFGYNQKIIIIGNFMIPDNYSFEGLPKNTKMMLPDSSLVFTRLSAINDQTLSTRITLDFKKPIYSVADYDYFKEFYKKMFNFLNEQFVIKKKP